MDIRTTDLATLIDGPEALDAIVAALAVRDPARPAGIHWRQETPERRTFQHQRGQSSLGPLFPAMKAGLTARVPMLLVGTPRRRGTRRVVAEQLIGARRC